MIWKFLKQKSILKWEFVSGSWKLAYEYSHLSSLLAASGEQCRKKAVFSGQLRVISRQLEAHMRHLHISHNASFLPPKILHKHCYQFLLGRLLYPGEIKNKGYAKYWGANKVDYGRCASGVFGLFSLYLQSQTKNQLGRLYNLTVVHFNAQKRKFSLLLNSPPSTLFNVGI